MKKVLKAIGIIGVLVLAAIIVKIFNTERLPANSEHNVWLGFQD